MQLFLILGIVFAIGAVSFAFQNDVPVTVMLSNWRFDSSLAVVLLVALGMGALIATLVSTPRVIEGQWARARLRRQIASVEHEKEILEQRLGELELEFARLTPEPAPATRAPAPYIGLNSMLPGERHPRL
jgi:uncharacterized integral membrane protein